jgi:hypothetical protein
VNFGLGFGFVDATDADHRAGLIVTKYADR